MTNPVEVQEPFKAKLSAGVIREISNHMDSSARHAKTLSELLLNLDCYQRVWDTIPKELEPEISISFGDVNIRMYINHIKDLVPTLRVFRKELDHKLPTPTIDGETIGWYNFKLRLRLVGILKEDSFCRVESYQEQVTRTRYKVVCDDNDVEKALAEFKEAYEEPEDAPA
jgi:hypothetical protein